MKGFQYSQNATTMSTSPTSRDNIQTKAKAKRKQSKSKEKVKPAKTVPT